jgi:ABC-type branched-subunit amino acid transport system ATPase component
VVENQAILALDRVSVRFGGLVALSEVSFTVRDGSVMALIGPNGAGKTTCFNTITGTQPVTSGTVHRHGADVTRLPPFRRAGIGRTFQIVQLFGEMTVRENVLVGLHRHMAGGVVASALRFPSIARQERWAHERADELLATVGLHHLADRVARTLPLGQQRLLELARALASEPQLVLLDELASGLSPAEIQEIVRHVTRMRTEGKTILLVEHNMRFVNRLAEHLVVLNYGKVIFDGTLEDGVRDPEVIKAYLGKEISHA